MPERTSASYLNLSFIGDTIATLSAAAVIGLSIADALKLYELEWYKHHQIAIVICLLAFLIIAVILERRFTTKRYFSETMTAIHKLTPDPLRQRLADAGIRNVYTSRSDYNKYRIAGDLTE